MQLERKIKRREGNRGVVGFRERVKRIRRGFIRID